MKTLQRLSPEEIDVEIARAMQSINDDRQKHEHKMAMHRITMESELNIARNERSISSFNRVWFEINAVFAILAVGLIYITLSALLTN